MLYTKNSEPQLSMELFRNPTSEYRGTPFWSWNCKVTRELIRSQMEVFQKMGFGGAHLINYILHISLLNLFLWLGFSKPFAPIPVFTIAIPVNFLLVRFVFKYKER